VNRTVRWGGGGGPKTGGGTVVDGVVVYDDDASDHDLADLGRRGAILPYR